MATGFVRNRKRIQFFGSETERFPGLNRTKYVQSGIIRFLDGEEGGHRNTLSIAKLELCVPPPCVWKRSPYEFPRKKMPSLNKSGLPPHGTTRRPIYRALHACADILVSALANRPYQNQVRIFRWLQKKVRTSCDVIFQ